MPRLAAQLCWRGLHFDALLLQDSGRIAAWLDGSQVPQRQILDQDRAASGAEHVCSGQINNPPRCQQMIKASDVSGRISKIVSSASS